FCEHYRAYRLFANSVNRPTRYRAVKCQNYMAYVRGNCSGSNIQFMGYAVNPRARGSYFLSTELDDSKTD
ncbi:Alpha/Beta hydrolase fold, partial [Gonioctena quinquepunctata]